MRTDLTSQAIRPDLVWFFCIMKLINIQAAKTHLSRIVDQVVAGQDVVLAKSGKPLVRLIPFFTSRQPRTPGLFCTTTDVPAASTQDSLRRTESTR